MDSTRRNQSTNLLNSSEQNGGFKMASATNRPATIHYRRLTDDMAAFNGTTLEAAMRKALLTKPHGKSLSLKDDFHLRLLSRTREEDCLFMNESQDGKAYLWGDLDRPPLSGPRVMLVQGIV